MVAVDAIVNRIVGGQWRTSVNRSKKTTLVQVGTVTKLTRDLAADHLRREN